MNNNEFGKRLKELRRSRGYTQQALAEKAEIDEKHLSRIENGRFFPSYATLRKLLKALDTNLEEAGIELENIHPTTNPLYIKALQILNSANNDDEIACYLDALKAIKKAFTLSN